MSTPLKSTTTKKRKSNDKKKSSTTKQSTSTDDVWYDIPIKAKKKIISLIEQCFNGIDERLISLATEQGLEGMDRNAELAYSLQEELDWFICPSYSGKLLERLQMTNLLYQAEDEDDVVSPKKQNPAQNVDDDCSSKKTKTDNANAADTVTMKKKQNIMRYVADMCRLVQKAVKVYEMLDTSNRGSIDKEDMYRALQELDMTPTTSETPNTQNSSDKISYETIIDMMTEFKPIHRGGAIREEQGIISVTFDDILRITKLLNL